MAQWTTLRALSGRQVIEPQAIKNRKATRTSPQRHDNQSCSDDWTEDADYAENLSLYSVPDLAAED